MKQETGTIFEHIEIDACFYIVAENDNLGTFAVLQSFDTDFSTVKAG